MEITIKKDTWTIFRKEKFVPPGQYIVVGKPSEEEKQTYPYIAANNPEGSFRWLLPLESWVLRKKFGIKDIFELEPGDLKGVDLDLLLEKIETWDETHDIPLRPWQATQLKKIHKSLSENMPFREELIAPLGAGKTLPLLIMSLCMETLIITKKSTFSSLKEQAEKFGVPMPEVSTFESAYKILGTKESNFTATNGIYKGVFLDECLEVKEPSTKRSQRITSLLAETPIVILQTGTPISAKEILDLRTLRVLGTIVPAQEKHWMWTFGINPHYDDLSKKGVELEPTDEGFIPRPLVVDGWKTEEVVKFIAPYMTVIDKKDLETLPPKFYEKVYFKKPRLFESVIKGAFTQSGTSKRITQARTITSGFVYNDKKEKIVIKDAEKVKWIVDFCKRNKEEPVIIFSHWKAEQEILFKALKEFDPARITMAFKNGEKFTRGETNVVIISASQPEGQNFQRARYCIFSSNSFSPYKREQGEGRPWRSGQNREVIFYDLICKGTLDETQVDLLQKHINESASLLEKQLAQKKVIAGVKEKFNSLAVAVGVRGVDYSAVLETEMAEGQTDTEIEVAEMAEGQTDTGIEALGYPSSAATKKINLEKDIKGFHARLYVARKFISKSKPGKYDAHYIQVSKNGQIVATDNHWLFVSQGFFSSELWDFLCDSEGEEILHFTPQKGKKVKKTILDIGSFEDSWEIAEGVKFPPFERILSPSKTQIYKKVGQKVWREIHKRKEKSEVIFISNDGEVRNEDFKKELLLGGTTFSTTLWEVPFLLPLAPKSWVPDHIAIGEHKFAYLKRGNDLLILAGTRLQKF